MQCCSVALLLSECLAADSPSDAVAVKLGGRDACHKTISPNILQIDTNSTKKLLGAPGIATRSKDATKGY